MKKTYWIDTKDIAYVSNIIESYEDVSLMSTVKKENNKSLVIFTGSDDFLDIFNNIIKALKIEGIVITEEMSS